MFTFVLKNTQRLRDMILLNVFFSLKPEHKIQSADGPLQLQLVQAPKMMAPLVKEWIPQAFTVSFKVH